MSPNNCGEQPAPGAADLADLLRRIGTGDEGALAEFYRRTSGRVFGLATRILRDRQLAEEATLDAYTQVWRTAGSYRAERGTPTVWLLMIARSRAIDMVRDHRIKMNAEDIASLATELRSPEPGPAETTHRRERAAQVRLATSQLPRGQREAIVAAYFGGLSQSEVSRTLDVPLGTVKTRIRTGMNALRRSLAEARKGMS